MNAQAPLRWAFLAPPQTDPVCASVSEPLGSAVLCADSRIRQILIFHVSKDFPRQPLTPTFDQEESERKILDYKVSLASLGLA